MTAPLETKTIRVSPRTHARIMEIAQHLGGTADQALDELLRLSTVHVPLTRLQHGRWKKGADEAGVTLEQFVKLRVEAALHGGNSLMIEKTYYAVRALARHHGVNPLDGIQAVIDDKQTP